MSTSAQPTFRINAQDPTETAQQRQSFQRDIEQRWSKVKTSVEQWFGQLRDAIEYNRLRLRFRNAFQSQAFDTVLESATDSTVDNGRHWTGKHVRIAYQRGLELARRDLEELNFTVYQAQQATKIQADAHQAALVGEYEQAYLGLEDQLHRLLNQVGNVMRDGIGQREDADWFIEHVQDRISKQGVTPGRAHANTTVVGVVNEALITAFEQAGVEDTGVAVEGRSGGPQRTNLIRVNAEGDPETYSEAVSEDEDLPDPSDPRNPDEVSFVTAGDDLVCEECQALSGTTVSISDIRASSTAFIPVHPNCRCRWVPLPPS